MPATIRTTIIKTTTTKTTITKTTITKQQYNQKTTSSRTFRGQPGLARSGTPGRCDRAEVTKAEAALAKVANPLRAEFAKSPEMTSAVEALKEAQKASTAAESAVLLHSQPIRLPIGIEGKGGCGRSTASVARRRSVAEDRASAATTVMNVGAVVTKMQADAERADPTLAQSRKDLVDADSKISELENRIRKRFATIPVDCRKENRGRCQSKLAVSRAAMAAVPRHEANGRTRQ